MLGKVLIDQMPLFGESRVMDIELVDDGLCEWMFRFVVVAGSYRWRCTFYPLAQLLAGEVSYGVGYATRSVRVRISWMVWAAEGGEAREYMVPFAISPAMAGGGLLFWSTDYPEVVKLACALDDLYA